jgi:excisionase family DNA binding protein
VLENVEGIAKVLQVSRTTVFKMIREGMPHKKLTERTLRFDTEEVLRWVSERQNERLMEGTNNGNVQAGT